MRHNHSYIWISHSILLDFGREFNHYIIWLQFLRPPQNRLMLRHEISSKNREIGIRIQSLVSTIFFSSFSYKNNVTVIPSHEKQHRTYCQRRMWVGVRHCCLAKFQIGCFSTNFLNLSVILQRQYLFVSSLVNKCYLLWCILTLIHWYLKM